ncbi:DNase I-like protein [Trematosphaeria pertusa]|uniref:DNase I-like protein n=1 Tax=Trematosphaeria pertusa TaxID=390896 RepID=A0A6A6J1W8_9PLEO|nr:DNase I-like protein [Trematosphaeria pertusa]KAF2256719.1 DNase I-like protein [Trematosphaeria pertusa]
MLLQLHAQISSWWHGTPLPARTPANIKFQRWNHYTNGRWIPLARNTPSTVAPHPSPGRLEVVTWNVDAGSPSPGPRISALLQTIEAMANADVIFLQDVNKAAIAQLLAHPWIQQQWYSSEADDSKFGKQSFATVTLISKICLFNHSISLGPIWRVSLPSRFDRDALCCDLVSNKTPQTKGLARIRLINVHLDSLPINPSRRPQQLSIIASYLRAAGHGLVAGDFNPVLPEDDEIVSDNGLVDAWTYLRPSDPGFTWGARGDKPFPPNRLDKVALHNLTPSNIRILQTSSIKHDCTDLEFSDHLGLSCVFTWN